MVNSQARRWTFTLNNYVDADQQRLRDLAASDRTVYLVFGREVGESGTPHLQGFVIFSGPVRFTAAKQRLGNNAHLEVARATSEAVATYCKKDGDFEEFGAVPSNNGRRSDFERYVEFVRDLGRVPSTRELVAHNPGLFARYERALIRIATHILPSPNFTGAQQPRFGWQTQVAGLIDADAPSPRTINFVVDPAGNSGKSWMCRYALSQHPDSVQVLRIGRRDDLAHAIDPLRSIFLFDVPRGQMMFLQYSVLESLKDQLVFSPKYESSCKVLRNIPTVIVFCNEMPDMNALTNDRYNIINI